MSRTSLKNKTKTTKATANVSRVAKRPVVVFGSGQETAVRETVWLYRVVFKTRQATLLALFFCVCFMSQPFHHLYANELEVVLPDEVPEPIVIVEEVEPIVLESSVTQINAQPTSPEDSLSTFSEVLADETTALEEVGSDIELVHLAEETGEMEPVPLILDEDYSTAEVGPDAYQSDTVDVASSSDDEGQYIENLHIISVVESDSAYSFSKDECTRIEGGSFYCQKRNQKELKNDTLIAAPDADGDLEIFLIREGQQIQITHNIYDDASPYFDETSKTIVWHRLLNDRYQIISFNPETGEELQLTAGDINNMEPARQGNYIVWQRWVNNNWEIILYDGRQELQITDSLEHDTSPHIRGSLIIWNSRSVSGEQMLKTYDIENQSFTTIADGEGVSVSNPRMVVMYEAMYENGDVIMKGFDLVTGEIIPLNAIPREMPEDIPSTDTTGETRALIQSKPSVRDTVVEHTNNPTPPIVPPLPDTDTVTLDLRDATLSDVAEDHVNIVEDIPVLVIPPRNTAE